MLHCIIIQGTKYNKLFNKKFDLILRFQIYFEKVKVLQFKTILQSTLYQTRCIIHRTIY